MESLTYGGKLDMLSNLTEFLPECLAEDELGVDGVVVSTHLFPGRLLTARQELA
jgi:hypothetical protein